MTQEKASFDAVCHKPLFSLRLGEEKDTLIFNQRQFDPLSPSIIFPSSQRSYQFPPSNRSNVCTLPFISIGVWHRLAVLLESSSSEEISLIKRNTIEKIKSSSPENCRHEKNLFLITRKHSNCLFTRKHQTIFATRKHAILKSLINSIETCNSRENMCFTHLFQG